MNTNVELSKFDDLLESYFIISILIEKGESVKDAGVADFFIGFHEPKVILELLNGGNAIVVSIISVFKECLEVLIGYLGGQAIGAYEKR